MPNNTYNPINDALNIKQRPEKHVAHTTFNRSYDFMGTGSMGQIIPFFYDETMPGDYWKIGGEYLFRFAPLYLPILSQVKVYVDYYHIPMRLLYGLPKKDAVGELAEYAGWENFISSFDDSLNIPLIDIPMAHYGSPSGSNVTDEIISYFGIPTNNDGVVTPGVLQVQPFIFLALLQIYDQYYRNDQVQDKRGFVWMDPLGQDYNTLLIAFNQFGQASYNPTPGGPADYLSKLRRNWDNDYYTVMTPTPQLGANVLIPMINDLSDFWQTATGAPGQTLSYPSQWKNLVAGATVPTPPDAIGTFNPDNITLIQGEYMGLDIQSTAASIRQLREKLQLTEILERAMRTGDKYDDFVFKFFEEDIDPLELNIPQWFGGHIGRVVVSDVFATANTTSGGTTPQNANTVGSYAGNAVAVDKIKQHHVKVREHGYVMGLLSVVPESSYQNGLHPMWTRQKWYDYPFEQFALIGDRPMKRMEMQLILASIPEATEYINTFMENEHVLGYVPQYHEMRYRQSVVSGQMRTLWESYHLGRILGQGEGDGIELGDELLLCRPRITDVFQVTHDSDYTEEEIHILVHNNVSVDRRLPKYAVPTTGL